MKKLLLIIFLLISGNKIFSQNFDSLWRVYSNIKLNDTVRIQALDDFIWEKIYISPDTVLQWTELEMKLAKKINKYKWEAAVYNNRGAYYFMKADYSKSENNHRKALALRKKNYDSSGIAASLNNIGVIYEVTYDYKKAVDCYLESMSISEKGKDFESLSNTCSNIGNIYGEIREFDYAFAYFRKALMWSKKNNDIYGIAEIYNNMAVLYHERGDLDSAALINRMSMKSCAEAKNYQCVATALNNIGMFFFDERNYDSALVYFQNAYEMNKKIGDDFSTIRCLSNLGRTHALIGNIKIAFKEINDALIFSSKNRMVDIERDSYEGLYWIYSSKNDFKRALMNYRLFVNLRDSIISVNGKNELNRQKLESEYENKRFADSLKQKHENDTIANQRKNEKRLLYISYFGVAFLLIFLFVLFQRFRITRKQNKIIAEQKAVVEEKQKEILDSIAYAKNLQTAILPNISKIKNSFPDSFLFYKPKDIVAGDFYFFEETNTHVFYAAADCTGHGVPGAMVSVVCANALTRAVKEFHLTDPGKILDKVREIIVSTFEKSEAEVKDGMDASLCVFDKREMKKEKFEIEFSGANNPLWLIYDDNFIDVLPDKQSVGLSEYASPFQTKKISVLKNTMLYMFTDGYADQFGGPKGKKFKYSNLQQLLLKIHFSETISQYNVLENEFNTWKGDLEQIDDVCIIGIRL